MGIVEKRVPQYLSLGVTASSLLVAAWLWKAGHENPRVYTSNMTINKHQAYGADVKPLSCADCHTPVGGTFSLSQEMNCSTAECHGELHHDTSKELKMELAGDIKAYRDHPEKEKKVSLYLSFHEQWKMKGKECWECHKEHSALPPLKLEDYVRLDGSDDSREVSDYTSLNLPLGVTEIN